MSILPRQVPPTTRAQRAGWLLGAAALGLLILGLFVWLPEPKSAGATDPSPPTAALTDTLATDLSDTATQVAEEAEESPMTAADSVLERANQPFPDSTATALPVPAVPDSARPAASAPDPAAVAPDTVGQ